jgi:hypothetical protein
MWKLYLSLLILSGALEEINNTFRKNARIFTQLSIGHRFMKERGLGLGD